MDANSVNDHVGQRLRQARCARGLTLQELGGAIGISSQQLSKFERRDNRVSARALFELSRVLDIEVKFFFEGLEAGAPSPSRRGDAEADLRLMIGRVDNATVRARLVDLVQTLEVSRF